MPSCGELQNCLHCHQSFEGKEEFCQTCGIANNQTSSQAKGISGIQSNVVKKTPNKPFNNKLLLSIIGIILAGIAIYFLFFNQQPSKPKNTISNFFNVFNQGYYQKMEEFVDPNNPNHVMDDLEFIDMPNDAQIMVVSFGDKH